MSLEKLTAYVESLLEKGVPGCELCIQRDHEVLYRRAFGFADEQKTKPVSGTERYYLYSCTKPITVAAAMQLVEKGLVGLDDPVADYLPEFSSPYLLKNGVRVPAKRVMRVRHLFTMSAGLNYAVRSEAVRELLTTTENPTTRQMVQAWAKEPLDFEPGTRFQYSLCHDVLAALVEVVSGKRYSTYLNDNIFTPLGMADTNFFLREDDTARLAAQYVYDAANNKLILYGTKNEYAVGNQYESGGAGLISTVSDYARFADAMACGGMGSTGARILKPETIELLRTEQLSKLVDDPTFECAAGPGYGYGLGVRTLIDKSNGQRSPLGEFGWDGAHGSALIVDPDHHLSFTFAQHIGNWPALLGHFYAPIRDITYDTLGL